MKECLKSVQYFLNYFNTYNKNKNTNLSLHNISIDIDNKKGNKVYGYSFMQTKKFTFLDIKIFLQYQRFVKKNHNAPINAR